MRIAFIILLVLLSDHEGRAQCNSEGMSGECISKLSSGFNFLKFYKIENDGSKDKVEYSYVFTKGTSYMITLCAEAKPAEGISILLFDSGRNRVASTLAANQSASGLIYQCNVTGIYYIEFSFAKPVVNCGASALGFKRQ